MPGNELLFAKVHRHNSPPGNAPHVLRKSLTDTMCTAVLLVTMQSHSAAIAAQARLARIPDGNRAG